MALLGIDPEAADSLAKVMATTAQNIEQSQSQLTSQLLAVTWHGPDAENFRSEWNSNAVRNLQLIVQMVQDAGLNLSRQAQAQRQVSGAG